MQFRFPCKRPFDRFKQSLFHSPVNTTEAPLVLGNLMTPLSHKGVSHLFPPRVIPQKQQGRKHCVSALCGKKTSITGECRFGAIRPEEVLRVRLRLAKTDRIGLARLVLAASLQNLDPLEALEDIAFRRDGAAALETTMLRHVGMNVKVKKPDRIGGAEASGASPRRK
jgi:hypothetical protein